ncbi:unnamed protein product [Adineta steineri]|uniref:Uncharacterized protein n=1 Tax=Adineta steineri TaxID=433720 RepID=A0A819TWQ0_9BILA|nr:unnamed protein product [Adineta steineri]CAF4081968.1 unnamed protein product [Adineta steineri]
MSSQHIQMNAWATTDADLSNHHDSSKSTNRNQTVSNGTCKVDDNQHHSYDQNNKRWTLSEYCSSLSPLFYGLLLGALIAGLVLAVVTTFWLTSSNENASTTGTWSITGTTNYVRYIHTASVLANGKVLVAGGTDSSGSSNSTELYDPSTGVWSTTNSMNYARFRHTASLLTNGKVLVASGSGSSGSLNSTELYDPLTGFWTTTGSINIARYFHTASVLTNGKVLVVDGYNGTSYLNSSELYES